MIVSLVILVNHGIALWKMLFEIEEKPNFPSPFRFEIPEISARSEIDAETSDIRFFPTVSHQRYQVVREILKRKLNFGGINKVVDFGCSEIRLFVQIKSLEGLREYLAVDVDDELLGRVAHRVTPLNAEYIGKRRFPLNAKVLHGSVTDPDSNLEGTNAVVAIELIEHLYPDVLEALPYNIFGVVQPEIAIFTTPNSDFNVFFPALKCFRHYDHKFEWSREQFRDWAENLTLRYPNYEVDICGVGPGPKGSEEFGSCSQLALFFRKTLFIEKSNEFKEFYRVIADVHYPYVTEEELKETMVISEIGEFLWSTSDSEDYRKLDRTEIPFKALKNHLGNKVQCDDTYLRSVLIKHNYDVETLSDGTFSLVLVYRHSSSGSLELENDHAEGYEYSEVHSEEDWDNYTEEASAKNKSPSPPHVFIPIKKEDLSQNGESILRCKSYDQIVDKNKCKNFRFSLNMEKNEAFEGDKIASCGSISDTFGSQSKAADSGYPNSINMDMDLTPEQVDEITTESESSFEDESGEEQVRHDIMLGVAHLLDNVENGDVANNNRDGEGNNMEDNQLGEPLLFQQHIHEDLAQPNDGAYEHDSEEESFFSSSRDAQIAECVSTIATVGSDPIASSNSLSGIPSISRYSPSQESDLLFPGWLLGIDVVEEADFGRGDAPVLDDFPFENDQNDSQQSLEVVVRGDVLGGGDPPGSHF